jgi:hypothetical protein
MGILDTLKSVHEAEKAVVHTLILAGFAFVAISVVLDKAGVFEAVSAGDGDADGAGASDASDASGGRTQPQPQPQPKPACWYVEVTQKPAGKRRCFMR